MAYTDIEEESRLRSTLSSDIDKYRNKYTTNEVQSDGSKINITFVSPSIIIFDRYRFYILQHSIKKKLDLKNKYRPDYVSYEEYGTTNWWELILWINDIPCLEEFDKDEILVPTMECVLVLADASSEIREIEELNQDHLKTTFPALLYHPSTHSMGKNGLGNSMGDINKVDESTDNPVDDRTVEDTVREILSANAIDNMSELASAEDGDRFRREIFTMDIPTLRLRYVDLEAIPIENSILLSVKYKSSFIYGKHYKVIESKDGKINRITWDPRIVTGSGLVFKLKEDDIVQISYVTKL